LKVLTPLRNTSEKSSLPAGRQAPPVVSKSTRQGGRPTPAITKKNSRLRSDRVRWPAKTRGAIGFGLIFLVLFLSRKKVRKELRYKFSDLILMKGLMSNVTLRLGAYYFTMPR
jgi:hypothetical protein